jgi:hypothetical protein
VKYSRECTYMGISKRRNVHARATMVTGVYKVIYDNAGEVSIEGYHTRSWRWKLGCD